MKSNRGRWLFWAGALVAVILCAVLLPFTYNLSFFIAAAAMITGFSLCAWALVISGKKPDALSGMVNWPLWQVSIGMLVMQTVLFLGLMALSSVCSWIVASLIACVILCIDAAALSVKTDHAAADGEKQE